MARNSLGGSDFLYLGLAAAAIYAAYKWANASTKGIETATTGLGGGISDAATGLGGGLGEIGDGIGAPFGFVDSLFDRLSKLVTDGGQTQQQQAPQYDNAGVVSAANPVLKVSSSGSAYNMRVDTIKTGKGSSNIIAAPNTYYKDLGVGFDAKSQGYSSAFAGNKPINATSIFTKSY